MTEFFDSFATDADDEAYVSGFSPIELGVGPISVSGPLRHSRLSGKRLDLGPRGKKAGVKDSENMASLGTEAGREAERRRPRADRGRTPRARNQEVVLVVEDDTAVRRTIAGMLRDLGYFVVEAETGTDGLRVLEQIERVDLLFTDVVMPGTMNGYQLAQEARRRRPGLKILYTSAYAENRLFDIAGSALQPLIRKPYEGDELAKAVRDALH